MTFPPRDVHVDLYGERRPGDDPVLLVMGMGMPGSMWNPIVPALSARYRVATFDQRGTGRSPGPASTSMSGLAEHTVRLLDRLGWSRAHLVGASLGGMVCLQLALDHPDRLTTLGLIGTHAGGLGAAIPTLSAIGVFLTSWRLDRRMARWLHPPLVREAMRNRAKEAAQKLAPARVLFAHWRAVAKFDVRDRLGEIRAPTLVIKPGQDIVVRPRCNDLLAERIPGARLVVRPESGHALIAHDAAAVGSLLLEHFARVSPSRA